MIPQFMIPHKRFIIGSKSNHQGKNFRVSVSEISTSMLIAMDANIVSLGIQPLQNLTVLNYIGEKVSPDEKVPWVRYHIGKGFAALEKLLKDHAGKYATEDEICVADLFLAPQISGVINRFNIDMAEFPLLLRLNEASEDLPAFQDAIPEKQSDAPAD